MRGPSLPRRRGRHKRRGGRDLTPRRPPLSGPREADARYGIQTTRYALLVLKVALVHQVVALSR